MPNLDDPLLAAIEPVIGHLKDDHRMGRNYLAHSIGDATNAVLAAPGYNFRRPLSAVSHCSIGVAIVCLRWSRNRPVAMSEASRPALPHYGRDPGVRRFWAAGKTDS